MKLQTFEEFPPDEQKRLFVQKAVNVWSKESEFPYSAKTFFLTNYTLNGIDVFHSYHLLKKKISPQTEFSDFNAIVQTLINSDSTLHKFSPDFLVLSLDLRIFIKDFYLNRWSVDSAANDLLRILNLIQEKIKAPTIVTDFIVPILSGGRQKMEDSLTHKVQTLNHKLMEYVQANSRQFFLVELNRIQSLIGVKESLDDRLWYQFKAPFKSPFMSMLARDISTIIGAHFGLSKKCIILDCDNTLWGGVVGEDGLNGIALDPCTYPGMAFYEFQSYLMNLHQNGILLAICSKNNEADVLEVLEKHPNCILKKEHFIAIRANWNKKAQNILDISKNLKLGVNNFVFIDDSDIECSLVQESIPDLDIIQAPKNPQDFVHIWNSEDIFYVPHRTQEDEQKQKQYKDNELREQSSVEFSDMSKFLKSLETSVELYKNQNSHIERIFQLTQKTNQFNLRTVRYTLQDIDTFFRSGNHVLFTMHVNDRFGDLGVTNACIMHLQGNGVAFLDTYLMSCRVIQRDLEFFFLNHCAHIMRKEYGVAQILAEFIPTKKNVIADGFLEASGFNFVSERDGAKKYVIQTDQLKPFNKEHIHISGAHS